MAFVLRAPWPDVPTELSRGFTSAVRPITSVTNRRSHRMPSTTPPISSSCGGATRCDVLARRRQSQRAVLGLHDWAHFHNHGAFEERTATELQCDCSALAWLWLNRTRVPIDEATWDSVRVQVLAIHEQRLVNDPPHVTFDDTLLRDADALRAWSDRTPRVAPT